MVKSKDDAAQPMDDAAHDDMASLPPLRDRAPDDKPAQVEANMAPHGVESGRLGEDDSITMRSAPHGDAPKDAEDKPAMTADEQRMADDREAHRQAQQRTDEQRKGMEERERMASRPNADALKLFLVRPFDSMQPPFDRSSTEDVVPVIAETPEYARHMAAAHLGQDVWRDAAQTVVYEFKPQSPMVMTGNAWKSLGFRHMKRVDQKPVEEQK